MGDWKHMRINSVAGQTQPTREPLFAIVPNAAQSGLSAMQAQRLNISKKMFSDFAPLVHQPSEIYDANPVRVSWKQHNRLMS
ncbi:hypothetical protein [Bradyrhizobium sp. CCBAU 11445]|uniref:hypothetical protein n=1 Tax=Bradyrhizobium sp. CCBAU 11445 TaxID=1630896 RepID=UPI0023057BF1|nr:hypothetical protein [Bradyrhizobium sp. CCBAU 11445]